MSAAPTADDIMKWTAIMFGPDGTIWEVCGLRDFVFMLRVALFN